MRPSSRSTSISRPRESAKRDLTTSRRRAGSAWCHMPTYWLTSSLTFPSFMICSLVCSSYRRHVHDHRNSRHAPRRDAARTSDRDALPSGRRQQTRARDALLVDSLGEGGGRSWVSASTAADAGPLLLSRWAALYL